MVAQTIRGLFNLKYTTGDWSFGTDAVLSNVMKNPDSFCLPALHSSVCGFHSQACWIHGHKIAAASLDLTTTFQSGREEESEGAKDLPIVIICVLFQKVMPSPGLTTHVSLAGIDPHGMPMPG